MIIDEINKLEIYQNLSPRFPRVVEYLKRNQLETLPLGKTLIDGEDIYVNIVDSPVKSRKDARLESHLMMIDIQIPLSGSEEHGYTPVSHLEVTPYDDVNDIAFYTPLAETYFELRPGEFVIYFPHDGHAPAITATGLRKAIIKVKY